MTQRTAAQRLVDCLVANDVSHVFCVPGESYLAVLDALHDVRDRIQLIACRHEAGAANMAEAYGKLTGKPGVCMVTRGPGATHAAIGVHTAHQDSTPMLLFVGQVARHDMGRGAFQEVDYGQAFGPLAKWASQIDDADRVAEFVGRGFAVAQQGRRGPVSNWSGPVWVLSSYYLAEGLARYGFAAQARELAVRTARLLSGDLQRTGALHECWNDAGMGLWPPTGTFVSWNVLAPLMLDRFR